MKRICLVTIICLMNCGGYAMQQNTQPSSGIQKQGLPANAKQLKKPQMHLLNSVFENKPMTSVRTKVAFSNATKTFNAIEALRQAHPEPVPVRYFANDADEKVFIMGSLKLVLDPVRKFLEDVHKFGNIISPLVVESLGENNKNSLFLRFFQTKGDKDDIGLFFEHEVHTIDDLRNACIEFVTVFGDMFESLSDKAHNGYEDLMKQIRNAQAAKKIDVQSTNKTSSV